MTRRLRIDRAIYLVDPRSYTFLARNPNWAGLSARQNLADKRSLDGTTRVFRGGRKKTFHVRRRASSC